MTTLRSTFLPSINALLAALALPFAIDHPSDLTPSLLLAIFESLISARLPIPAAVRQSRTRDAKARAMLVLLGVLECDVLRGGTSVDAEHSVADDSVLAGAGGVSVDGWVDEIGLGEVDPERLADGGWEETIFVGELLCWLARRKGILPRTKSLHPSPHPRSLYSNHHSYGTEGDTADFSTSLLLRPSSAQTSRPPRPPSPSSSVGDIDADCSALSHITDVPRHPLVHSPEPSLSASATTGTDLSIRARSVSSRTSVSNAHNDPDDFEEASQDTMHMHNLRQMMQDAEDDDDRPPTFRPRCIHELDDPSYIRALAGPSSSFDPSVSHERASDDEDEDASTDDGQEADEQYNDGLHAPLTPTPRRVRLTGWIDTIDTAAELSHFTASRAHFRSRAINTSASSGLGSPSRPYTHARIGGLSESTPRLQTTRTPRRISPSPSPSPSPPPPTSSKRFLPTRLSPSPPPSPPTYSDPPFDVSFSTLNNTSTPAKPRLPRRPQFQATTAVDEGGSGGSIATAGTRSGSGRLPPRRRDRSPSYTPSPPSFSTPGSLRSGIAGTTSGTRAHLTGSSGPKTRMASSTPPAATTRTRTKNVRSTSPSPMSTAVGSTAMTNALLTERARLLTELAVLKRAHAVSGSRTGAAASGMEIGQHIGIGV